MYFQLSWSSESSYETPRLDGPYDTLEEIAERYGPDEVTDNRHDEDTLYHDRVVVKQPYGWSEISDDEAERLADLQSKAPA